MKAAAAAAAAEAAAATAAAATPEIFSIEVRIKSRDSVSAETRDWDPELNPQNRIYLIYWFSN